MKFLFLLRHAHSEKINGKDFNRPLSIEGLGKCKEIADNLQNKNFDSIPLLSLIEEIICSSAIRTKQTAENIFRNSKIKISYDDLLYKGEASYIHELISLSDNNINGLLIIGHNPAIAQFCLELDQSVPEFLPGSLAIFRCTNDNWQKINSSNVKLIEFWQ